MEIRVAINKSYGVNYLPEFIMNQIDKNKNFRVEIARVLDELNVSTNNLHTKYKELLKGNRSYLKFQNQILFYDKKENMTAVWTVEEVDTNIPWRIDEYDGAESIKVFNGIKIIDGETGESDW